MKNAVVAMNIEQSGRLSLPGVWFRRFTGLACALGCSLALSAQATVQIVQEYAAPSGLVFKSPYGDGKSFYSLALGGSESLEVSLTVHLGAKDVFSGFAAYDSGGWFWDGDAASVSVVGASSLPTTLLTLNGTSDPVDGVIGWTWWHYDAPSEGDYTFTYTATSSPFKEPVAFFAPVPEASTWLAGAFAGLTLLTGIFRRRDRRS